MPHDSDIVSLGFKSGNDIREKSRAVHPLGQVRENAKKYVQPKGVKRPAVPCCHGTARAEPRTNR